MSTSFLVRKTNFGKYDKKKVQQGKIYVDPPSVIFQQCTIDESYISKIHFHNQTLKIVECHIQQPKKPSIKVRIRSTVVQPYESVQIFISFNCTELISSIEDQFLIHTMNQTINVPIKIICKEKNQRSYFKIETKQNIGDMNFKKKNMFTRSSRKLTKVDKRKNVAFLHNPLSNKKIDELIKDFICKFEKIEESLRDKSILNQNFIGQKSLPMQNYPVFHNFNYRIVLLYDEKQKQIIQSRFSTEFCQEGPVICHLPVYPKFPRWNTKRNIPSITKDKGMRKLQQQVRKLVINYRFEKINKIRKIYHRFQEEEKINKGVEKMIMKRNSIELSLMEFRQFSRKQIGGTSSILDLESQNEIQVARKHKYFCRKISHIIENKNENKSCFQFNKFTLSPRFLEIDHEEGRQSFKSHQFQIQARIGFDNWITLEEVRKYSHQTMKYGKIIQVQNCYFYIKASLLRQFRSGSELQYLRNIYNENIENVSSSTLTFFQIPSLALQHPINYETQSFSAFKNLTTFEIQFNYRKQQNSCLLTNVLFYENSLMMRYIGHFRQEFFPHFSKNTTSLYNKLVDDEEKKILTKIDREDRLKIENIVEDGKYTELYPVKQNKIFESLNSNYQDLIFFRMKEELEDTKHEKKLQNLKRIKKQEMDNFDVHVFSLNHFTRRKENKIYF